MTDQELERLLRSVRPAGPPPQLRARIASARPVPRTWPWALAAAALLVATVTLHRGADRLAASGALPQPGVTVEDAVVSVLAEMLGGDDEGRAAAELMFTVDRLSVAPEPVVGAPPPTVEQQ